MTRLASRSPAAPFQSSRPAPVKPQRPPQSTTTTEAQTLRQMVQEREEEIYRLRESLYNCWKIFDQTHHDPQHRINKALRQIPEDLSDYNALNDGGDNS